MRINFSVQASLSVIKRSRAFSTKMAERKHWDGSHLAAGSESPNLPTDKISLYNMRFCPYAERAVLVLLAKGIPFHNININLKKKPDWFLKDTLGKVPVYINPKGDIILESLIICDYLDEVHPDPPLHPKDPLQKAKDRGLVEKFSVDVISPFYGRFFGRGDAADYYARLDSGLAFFEQELADRGTPFYAGETPGMIDYMIWPWMERMSSLEGFTMKGAKLEGWIEKMWKEKPIAEYGLKPEIHKQLIDQYINNPSNIDYDFLWKK